MNVEGRTAESPSETATQPGLLQRVVLVFTSPAKLGELLRAHAPWFWTFFIIAVIGGVALILMPTEFWRQALEQRAQSQQAGVDLDRLATITRFSQPVVGLVLSLVFIAAAAGVLYLTFNVALGQDVLYKQHLSGMAHIWWIVTLGALLVIPIKISKGDMQLELGLGLLLPEAPESFGGHYINSITIFGLWAATALGLAESGISGGRISSGKAVLTTVILYLVIACVIKAVLASMGG